MAASPAAYGSRESAANESVRMRSLTWAYQAPSCRQVYNRGTLLKLASMWLW